MAGELSVWEVEMDCHVLLSMCYCKVAVGLHCDLCACTTAYVTHCECTWTFERTLFQLTKYTPLHRTSQLRASD